MALGGKTFCNAAMDAFSVWMGNAGEFIALSGVGFIF